MGTAKGDGYTFTPRDLELMVIAIGCTRLPFEIQYDKLATRLGYKNQQSAKAAWNALRKKLVLVEEGVPVVPSLTIMPEETRQQQLAASKAAGEGRGSGSASAKTKAKVAAKAKQKAAEIEGADDDEEDFDGPKTPPPKSKARKMQAKHSRTADNDVEGDVDVTGTGYGLAAEARPKGKATTKQRHVAPPSSTSDSGSEAVKSETPADRTPTPARKNLKRKLEDLRVGDRAKMKAMSPSGEMSGGRSQATRTQRSVGPSGEMSGSRSHTTMAQRYHANERPVRVPSGGVYVSEDEDGVPMRAPPPAKRWDVKREEWGEGNGAAGW